MTKLETINAGEFQNRTYEPTHFLVDVFISEGLHILAGAPKIGKSWLTLWLCLCVAQGQALWNFATTQGDVLYLGLEDSLQHIQTRLFDLVEDAPPTLHFAIMANMLKHGVEQQNEQFLVERPPTKLAEEIQDQTERTDFPQSGQKCPERDGEREILHPGMAGLGYFGIVSMKMTMKRWDEWLRRRLRVYIWKKWKLPKARIRSLMKLAYRSTMPTNGA